MNKLRLLIIFLIIAMTVSFSSCSEPQDSLGEIEEIEIDGKTTEEEAPGFERQECPLTGYGFQTINNYTANMSFDIPSTWRAFGQNPNTIRLEVPMDDPHFPGNVFYIQYVYDYVTENELDDAPSDAQKFYHPFMTYIEGLEYVIGGGDAGSMRRWRGGFDVEGTPSFVSDDSLAYTVCIDDEILYNKDTSSIVNPSAAFTATFFKWQTFPVMISTWSTFNQADDAADMTEFIMSTSTYIPQKMGATDEYKVAGHEITLPAEFEKDESSNNIFRSSESLSSTEGISLGVYKLPVSLEEDLDSYDLFEKYGDRVAKDLADIRSKSKYTTTAAAASDLEPVDDGQRFYSYANYVALEPGVSTASCVYGDATCYPILSYLIQRDDSTYLISILYAPQQEKLAETIGNLAIRSFK